MSRAAERLRLLAAQLDGPRAQIVSFLPGSEHAGAALLDIGAPPRRCPAGGSRMEERPAAEGASRVPGVLEPAE